MRIVLTLLAAAVLTACSGDPGTQAPTEKLALRPWTEAIEANGEIKAASVTSLNVPGSGWSGLELVDMVAEGSLVKAGDVVARFDAPQARMELSQSEAELLRKLLAEQGLQGTGSVRRAELQAEKAKVVSDLGLSERYAGMDAGVFSRNQIIDAIQDGGFLRLKQAHVNWKTGQVDKRGAADLAVLNSQKQSIEVRAAQRRKTISSLEIRAPHDGIFQLKADWDGDKPKRGATLWPGQDFGSFPDMENLVATFQVPESDAHGLKPGLAVRVRLTGSATEVDVLVDKVGSTATTISRESPVKYLEFSAKLGKEMIRSAGFQPGQAVGGTVRVVERKDVLTVPNVALIQEGEKYAVMTGEALPGKRVEIQLGQRGATRSEVKSGLKPGDVVLLLPEQKKKEAKKEQAA
jgi:multidrug efflux pump subunit AcrA (membrane-fusion protein)